MSEGWELISLNQSYRSHVWTLVNLTVSIRQHDNYSPHVYPRYNTPGPFVHEVVTKSLAPNVSGNPEIQHSK